MIQCAEDLNARLGLEKHGGWLLSQNLPFGRITNGGKSSGTLFGWRTFPFHVVVKAGSWFWATLEKTESFTLVGCTVSPGFDFRDFELPDRGELFRLFPDNAEIIEMLTRRLFCGGAGNDNVLNWKKSL
ncbi:MAG: hypothetical protein EHM79_05825 [Geobacter sp.]|nr:MAG: hypothetical protein EHM79_05825 [Geobacter sp.]